MSPRADERIASTVGIREATGRLWDVIVVGAGPAGAVSAMMLARRSVSVLLLERSALPREKVCGGCVGAAAVEALKHAGLDVPAVLPELPRLESVAIRERGRRVNVPLRGGLAVSRAKLDACLVREAIASGAELLTEASAIVTELAPSSRVVDIRAQGDALRLQGRVVVLAAGLAPHLGGDAGLLAARLGSNTRIGLSAITPAPARASMPKRGQIVMACGRGGYVGLTILEQGRLNIAAALDPAFIRSFGGAEAAVRTTLAEAGLRPPDLTGLRWRGTPPLTRAPPRVSLPRLLLVGDAAGYVEPFTGEGIGWAVAGAIAAADIVEAGMRRWNTDLEAWWMERHRRLIASRQRTCRAVSATLRRPTLRSAAFSMARRAPSLAGVIAAHVQRPLAIPTQPAPAATESPAVPLLPATL